MRYRFDVEQGVAGWNVVRRSFYSAGRLKEKSAPAHVFADEQNARHIADAYNQELRAKGRFLSDEELVKSIRPKC